MKKILVYAIAMLGAMPTAAHASTTVDLDRKICVDPAGYKLDFSGSGTGGTVSGVWINQRFVGHWRVRSSAIVVDWQMIDEGGQSERLRCSQKGNILTCRKSGARYTFKCRRGSSGY